MTHSSATSSPETPQKHPIPDDRRAVHTDWLRELTAIPTAAGREGRVLAWIDHWLSERPELTTRADEHGNLEIRIDTNELTEAPLYFTAHLDHPAFVVESQSDPDTIVLSFRGGVMSDYFPGARIRVHHEDTAHALATVIDEIDTSAPEWSETDARPFKLYRATLDKPADIETGTIATWDLPDPEIIDDEFGGILHTNACDDLAALAAALCALDELRLSICTTDVRVLCTRAEEIGFVGAIGACKANFMPRGSRLIALENSRAFPDAPIHAGPIVRVGDRVSVFSPELTGAVAQVAQTIAGGPATPKASQKQSEMPTWKWQRKLMAGGACEASVFCAMGYQATCVCLPLGNYHNMANLSEVQAGTYDATPRVGREYIGLDDYAGMVDLLIACAQDLPDSPSFASRLDDIWTKHASVLQP
jgi:endoglucanase